MNAIPTIRKLDLMKHTDNRRVILVTGHAAETLAGPYLQNLSISSTIYIKSEKKEQVDEICSKRPAGDIIYAVGGGMVMDVARLLGMRWGLEVICIPTMLSSDAFLVDSTGIRNGGTVEYVPSITASEVLIDWSLLAKTPQRFHISGSGDVLSIFTALEDWARANDRSEVPADEAFNASVFQLAKDILDCLLGLTSDTPIQEQLETLLTCLVMEVALCNFYGNSRPEEGGEHYFAYCIENKMPHFLHGEMVAFGILITAFLQGQEWEQLESFMSSIDLNYKSASLSRHIVTETLRELPTYVTKHKLRHSVYNEFDYDIWDTRIDDFLNQLGIV